MTPDGIIFNLTETFTISAARDVFAGVKGSFTMKRWASPTTFMIAGSFHGTITSPGAVR